jgi:hypothetical protein
MAASPPHLLLEKEMLMETELSYSNLTAPVDGFDGVQSMGCN